MLQKVGMATELGAALLEARKLRKMPASRIATDLNVKVQAIYNWEKGRNHPAAKNVIAVARVLNVDPTELLHGRVVLLNDGSGAFDRRDPPPRPDVEFAADAPAYESLVGRRDVAELGISVGGEEGDFELNGEVQGYHPRPPALAGREIFAVRIKGSSMSKKYEEGDLVYVERKRQPVVGDYAIVELHPDDEGAAGRSFIKQLVSKNSEKVTVLQFNPEKTLTFERKHVKHLYRVIPWNEVLGT